MKYPLRFTQVDMLSNWCVTQGLRAELGRGVGRVLPDDARRDRGLQQERAQEPHQGAARAGTGDRQVPAARATPRRKEGPRHRRGLWPGGLQGECHILYKVDHLLANLGWVDLDFESSNVGLMGTEAAGQVGMMVRARRIRSVGLISRFRF